MRWGTLLGPWSLQPAINQGRQQDVWKFSVTTRKYGAQSLSTDLALHVGPDPGLGFRGLGFRVMNKSVATWGFETLMKAAHPNTTAL